MPVFSTAGGNTLPLWVRRLFCFIIGGGMLAAAIPVAISTYSFVRRAERAPGVVVATPFGGAHPEIEFLTRSGQRISYPQGGLIFGYKPGDKVRVLYDASSPASDRCVDAFGAIWAASLFLAGIGLSMLIVGLIQD